MAQPGAVQCTVECTSCKVQQEVAFPQGLTNIQFKCSNANCGAEFPAQRAAELAPSAPAAPAAPAEKLWHAYAPPTIYHNQEVPVAVPIQVAPIQPVAQPQPVLVVGGQQARMVQAPVATVAMPAGQIPVGMPAAQPLMRPMNHWELPTTPCQVTCPQCGAVGVTAVDYQMGTGPWAVCLGLCCFGVGVVSWAGLLPCCMTECQDAHHYCSNPSCHPRRLIGVKKFLF